jgi:hypothetical protein
MQYTSFTIKLSTTKKLTLTTKTHGLIIKGKEYLAENDGVLIYDKTKRLKANAATCQLSTNTSTLIPALRTLEIPYNQYFDKRDVIDSQNNITFYWKPSKLAAFYNRYSTDQVDYENRESVIRKAVTFLVYTANKSKDFLSKEVLDKTSEPVKLLGFYEGFPIFDNKFGFAKLLSRLGIHIDENETMLSTPLPEHADTVYELSKRLERKLKVKAAYKSNRVVFKTTNKLRKELMIS